MPVLAGDSVAEADETRSRPRAMTVEALAGNSQASFWVLVWEVRLSAAVPP